MISSLFIIISIAITLIGWAITRFTKFRFLGLIVQMMANIALVSAMSDAIVTPGLPVDTWAIVRHTGIAGVFMFLIASLAEAHHSNVACLTVIKMLESYGLIDDDDAEKDD